MPLLHIPGIHSGKFQVKFCLYIWRRNSMVTQLKNEFPSLPSPALTRPTLPTALPALIPTVWALWSSCCLPAEPFRPLPSRQASWNLTTTCLAAGLSSFIVLATQQALSCCPLVQGHFPVIFLHIISSCSFPLCLLSTRAFWWSFWVFAAFLPGPLSFLVLFGWFFLPPDLSTKSCLFLF